MDGSLHMLCHSQGNLGGKGRILVMVRKSYSNLTKLRRYLSIHSKLPIEGLACKIFSMLVCYSTNPRAVSGSSPSGRY
jgi:hypothetical protein